jgi:uncharacterized membrane protein YeiH
MVAVLDHNRVSIRKLNEKPNHTVKFALQGAAGCALLMYVLDLLGVAVFAVSGALAGVRRGLDLFGVTVLAAVTAIGGGTVRDVLLGRHPVFWVRDPKYLYVIVATTALTLLGQTLITNLETPLLVADAVGLALFALSGAQSVEAEGHAWIVVVLMGTMTGVAGGVIRDMLSGVVPLLLRRDIYATAAIAGISFYLVMQAAGVRRRWSFITAVCMVIALRLAALRFDWQLPVFGNR